MFKLRVTCMNPSCLINREWNKTATSAGTTHHLKTTMLLESSKIRKCTQEEMGCVTHSHTNPLPFPMLASRHRFWMWEPRASLTLSMGHFDGPGAVEGVRVEVREPRREDGPALPVDVASTEGLKQQREIIVPQKFHEGCSRTKCLK